MGRRARSALPINSKRLDGNINVTFVKDIIQMLLFRNIHIVHAAQVRQGVEVDEAAVEGCSDHGSGGIGGGAHGGIHSLNGLVVLVAERGVRRLSDCSTRYGGTPSKDLGEAEEVGWSWLGMAGL